MNKKKIAEVAASAETFQSELTEAQRKQSEVTQRMIGMHKGRNRGARILKKLSTTILLLVMLATVWWILSELKKEDQSWIELFEVMSERLLN